jgi:hypothetical protein
VTTPQNPANVLKLTLTEIDSPNRGRPPKPEIGGLLWETYMLDTPEGKRVLLIEVIQNPDPARKITMATIGYDHTGQKIYEFLDWQSAWDTVRQFLNAARGLPTTGYVHSIPPLLAEAASSGCGVEMRWKHSLGTPDEPVMRITAWADADRGQTGTDRNDQYQNALSSCPGIQLLTAPVLLPEQPKGFVIPDYPFARPCRCATELSSKIERKRKRDWWQGQGQGQGWRILVAGLLAVVTVISWRRLVAFFRCK